MPERCAFVHSWARSALHSSQSAFPHPGTASSATTSPMLKPASEGTAEPSLTIRPHPSWPRVNWSWNQAGWFSLVSKLWSDRHTPAAMSLTNSPVECGSGTGTSSHTWSYQLQGIYELQYTRALKVVRRTICRATYRSDSLDPCCLYASSMPT